MNTIDPAAIELPPTEPLDITALVTQALGGTGSRFRDTPM